MFRRLRTASAHSRGQMQFGCHRWAYFWTSVACMSIIRAFSNYVSTIMLIFPPFHLRWNSARAHYQRGGDTGQDELIIHLVTPLVGLALMSYIFKEKQNCDCLAFKPRRVAKDSEMSGANVYVWRAFKESCQKQCRNTARQRQEKHSKEFWRR